jgi:hypothetical protein
MQQPPETTAADSAVEITTRPPDPPSTSSSANRIHDDWNSGDIIQDGVDRRERRERVRCKLVDELS